MRIRFLLASLLLLSVITGTALRAQTGDTVVVQTLTFDSASRAGVYHFPENDATTYERVIMQYSMRCHNALVSDQNNRNKGCGEWDYNCETYITDSLRTDSVKQKIQSAIISNYPAWTNFPYTTRPTYSYTRRNEKSASFGATPPAFTHVAVGTGTLRVAEPLGASSPKSRTFYLFKAAELKAAGLQNGLIRGMGLTVLNAGSALGAMQIKFLKSRSGNILTLDDKLIHDAAFTTVYYSTTPAPSGSQDYYFYQPIDWADTLDLVMEVSFTNGYPGLDNTLSGSDVGFATGLTASADENVMQFDGSESVSIPTDNLGKSMNEITVSVWTNGDSATLPANSALLEATDSAGNRQINMHLPWSDNNIYWDCGADGGNFDRINKVTVKANFAGGWNHWAFTKNATTGKMAIYLNGSLFMSDTGKHRLIFPKNLMLGGSLTSTLNYFGQVSQLSIWNKALDSTSIQTIMKHDIKPTDPNIQNLVAYYKLNEGTGAVSHDSSAAHANAKVIGVPVWRKVAGRDLHTNFSTRTTRPNVKFLQFAGTVTPTVTDQFMLDTLLDAPHSVTRSRIIRDDSIGYVDTTYKWLAQRSYIRDERGVKVDSILISAEDTVRVTPLIYYQKWPQKFEIMSFVTPYGIGLDLGKNGKMYQFDATDYLPILHGWKRLSIERGAGQEELAVRFLFIKGKPAHDVIDIQQIWPMTEEGYQAIVSDDRYEPRNVYINRAASDFKIRSMITGHGQEGEFLTRMHHVTVGAKKYEWEVVKTCADNPLYPQGGTWIYTRAGWCPGAPTLETEYDVTSDVKPGDSVKFDYGVVGATGDSRYDASNQFVSYGAPNFALNAGIYELQRPSDRIEFGRINPACDLPIVVLQNNGSQKLTSVKFEYYVDGGPHKTYDWKGSLNFLDTISVTLPVDSLAFWTGNLTGNFHVDLLAPNGGTDEYDHDNHYSSVYNQPPAYKGAVVVNFKSNTNPQENYYEIRDMSGKTVFSNSTFDANKTYYDSLALPVGCYSIIFHDDGGDGISFWNNAAQGTGSLRLRQSNRTGKVLWTANPDFGLFTQFDFSIYSTSGVEQSAIQLTRLALYPNPSRDKLTVELSGYKSGKYTLEVVDNLGRVLRTAHRTSDALGNLKSNIDIKNLPSGSYFLRLTSGSDSTERPFVIE
ncbi:MAG: T9SS type A sorting domain-containing protein [Candidatus Kapaibacterium sp.]